MNDSRIHRRHFGGLLSSVAGVALANSPSKLLANQTEPTIATDTAGGARTTLPIGISTYSLWRFKNDEFKDVGKCIEIAGEYGFDGVEILLYQISQT
ncbi:MAG: hypothetical protein ACK48K_00685, partial [Planctomycetota bacterium]